jgi:hypothetical protein
MEGKEMNGGVEILLARMDTHPEEFFRDSRWRNLIMDFVKDLPKEDVQALENKLKECRQKEFTGIVLERLVTEEKEEKRLKRNYSNPMMFHGFTQLNTDEEDMKEDGLSDAQIAVIRKMKGEK